MISDSYVSQIPPLALLLLYPSNCVTICLIASNVVTLLKPPLLSPFLLEAVRLGQLLASFALLVPLLDDGLSHLS
jgi:hypothetical protein